MITSLAVLSFASPLTKTIHKGFERSGTRTRHNETENENEKIMLTKLLRKVLLYNVLETRFHGTILN